jgi:hypothetical protein
LTLRSLHCFCSGVPLRAPYTQADALIQLPLGVRSLRLRAGAVLAPEQSCACRPVRLTSDRLTPQANCLRTGRNSRLRALGEGRQQALDEGWQVAVLLAVRSEERLGDEHVEYAAQAAGEYELAGRAVGTFFPAA